MKKNDTITYAELQSETFKYAFDVAEYRTKKYAQYSHWTNISKFAYCLQQGAEAVIKQRKE